MEINRENYESIMVDYLDGNLTPEREAELMLFLFNNPDIAEEIEGLKEVTIDPSHTLYPQKKSLKKNITQPFGINNEVDYLCIAELEGDISEEEKERLKKLIEKDNSIQLTKTVFTNTKLVVPHEIVYPYKSGLKRLLVIPIRRTTYRIAMSIAATVTIMFAVYTVVDLNTSSLIVTETSKPTTIKEQSFTTPQADVEKPSKYSTTENRQNIRQTTELKSIEETNTKNLTDNIREEVVIEKIQLLPVKLDYIAQIDPVKLDISAPINKHEIIAETTNSTIVQNSSSTKEYTLSDLANIGLKRVANSLGIEYNIKKNDKGKVEKLSIESSLLAFSTTRGNKIE